MRFDYETAVFFKPHDFNFAVDGSRFDSLGVSTSPFS